MVEGHGRGQHRAPPGAELRHRRVIVDHQLMGYIQVRLSHLRTKDILLLALGIVHVKIIFKLSYNYIYCYTCCTGGPPQRQSFCPSWIVRRAAADIGGNGDDPGMRYSNNFNNFKTFTASFKDHAFLEKPFQDSHDSRANFVPKNMKCISSRSSLQLQSLPAAAAAGNADGGGGSASYNAAIPREGGRRLSRCCQIPRR